MSIQKNIISGIEEAAKKMVELNEDELAKISAGVMTEDAESWVSRNEATVRSRAQAKGYSSFLIDLALNIAESSETVYDVAALKQAITDFGIDVSDLN